MKTAKVLPAFTLIEMMVAVAIFAIVMMIGVGALLTMIEVNKRAQAINSVMNNLNAAVEDMSRSVRVGSTYHCETSASAPSPDTLAEPKDCATGGGLLFAFEATGGDPTNSADQVVYRLNGTQLERSLSAGAGGTWVAITAAEVKITNFQFYVTGSASYTSGNHVQPRLLMIIHGTASVPGGPTDFTVQSSVTERLLDI